MNDRTGTVVTSLSHLCLDSFASNHLASQCDVAMCVVDQAIADTVRQCRIPNLLVPARDWAVRRRCQAKNSNTSPQGRRGLSRAPARAFISTLDRPPPSHIMEEGTKRNEVQ